MANRNRVLQKVKGLPAKGYCAAATVLKAKHRVLFSVIFSLALIILSSCSGQVDPVKNSLSDSRCMGSIEKLDISPGMPTKGNGFDIINGIFEAVNIVMFDISQTFYNSIISNPNFSNAVNAVTILYLAVYGVMIMFGLAPFRANEVISRLIKISILWSMIAFHPAVGPDGWTFFSKYIGNPVIDIMNQIISEFVTAGESLGITATAQKPLSGDGSLSPISLSMLTAPMNIVFSMRFAVFIIGLIFTGPFGWFFALLFLWAIVDFVMMVIAGTITYVKSVVALSFLFAIAPIFFTFMLFEQTKQIFMKWANTIMGFFIQPILFFGFISFFGALLTSILVDIVFSTDFCNLFWFQFFIMPVHFWRPVSVVPPGIPGQIAGQCTANCNGGDWIGGPPIDIMKVFIFILLAHIAKGTDKIVGHLSGAITGGYSGAGIIRGSAVAHFVMNHILGLKGRRASDFIAGGFARMKHGMQVSKETRVREALNKRGVLNDVLANASSQEAHDIARASEMYEKMVDKIADIDSNRVLEKTVRDLAKLNKAIISRDYKKVSKLADKVIRREGKQQERIDKAKQRAEQIKRK